MAQARGGPGQDGVLDQPAAGGADEVAQMAGAAQLAVGDGARRAGFRRVRRGEARAALGEIVQRGQQQPGTEVVALAGDRATARRAAPDERTAVAVGPDGDDTGRGVPAPEPFVLRGHGRGDYRARRSWGIRGRRGHGLRTPPVLGNRYPAPTGTRDLRYAARSIV